MDFQEQIIEYENNISRYDFIIRKGRIPIIFTAVHTVMQEEKGKMNEPFTGAIGQYIGNKTDCFCLIKAMDNGIDSNSVDVDGFKEMLLKIIKENNIELLIDLHGAKRSHDFDVELGTLCGLSVDLSTQNTLMDCLNTCGIDKIDINDPFMGGGITRYIYENSNIDIVQIEINKEFRDIKDLDKCEKVCKGLIQFIEEYTKRR